MNVQLYARENGTFGIRNRIAVISTVACANHVAQQIAAQCPLADAYTHPYGCDQLGADLTLSIETLRKVGVHPNVGAVLVVGLGCEEISAEKLGLAIRQEKTATEFFEIQKVGGTTASVEKGAVICRRFESELLKQERVSADISNLIVGVECGGSDFTSGIAANPAVGKVTEKLCELGATVLFGETTELMGTEEILADLCEKPEHMQFINEKIKKIEDVAKSMHVDLRGTQPSPGNIDGGLSTIEEKSLGSVCKIGRAKINGVLEFAQTPKTKGLFFMDTPGNDIACSLGLSAGGAHVTIFTTGRGTPMGFIPTPLLKVTANQEIASLMRENMDVDLSDLIECKSSIAEGGERVFEKLISVVNGEETASETLGHREFSLYRISPILT